MGRGRGREGKKGRVDPSAVALLFLLFTMVVFMLRGVPLKMASVVIYVNLMIAKILSIGATFTKFVSDGMVLFMTVFVMKNTLFRAKVTGGVKKVIAGFTGAREALVVTVVIVMKLVDKVLSGAKATTILVPMIVKVTTGSKCGESELLVPLMFTTTVKKGLSLVNTPKGLVTRDTLDRVKLGFKFFRCTIINVPVLVTKVVFCTAVNCGLLPDRSMGSSKTFSAAGSFDSIPG